MEKPFWMESIPDDGEDDQPYMHGLTFGLYKAGCDLLLREEFGGRPVTNLDGKYSDEEVAQAAEIIRREEYPARG
jgi:hypothetical protein